MISLYAQSVNLIPELFVKDKTEELPRAQFKQITHTFISICGEITEKSCLCIEMKTRIEMKTHIEKYSVKCLA